MHAFKWDKAGIKKTDVNKNMTYMQSRKINNEITIYDSTHTFLCHKPEINKQN